VSISLPLRMTCDANMVAEPFSKGDSSCIASDWSSDRENHDIHVTRRGQTPLYRVSQSY